MYDRAIEILNYAIAQNAFNDATFVELGIAYNKQMMLDESISSYESAISLNSTNEAALTELSYAFNQKQMY